MYEIEKLLRANQGSTLTKQMVDKLIVLIDAYGNDCNIEGWHRGYESAEYNDTGCTCSS